MGTRANPGDFHDGFKDFWKVFYFLTGFLFLRGFYFFTGTGSRNVLKWGFGPAAGGKFWGILRFRIKHPLVSQGGFIAWNKTILRLSEPQKPLKISKISKFQGFLFSRFFIFFRICCCLRRRYAKLKIKNLRPYQPITKPITLGIGVIHDRMFTVPMVPEWAQRGTA